MLGTIEIPLLRDHHTHLSLYAALAGCPSILGLPKAEALRLLRGLPQDRLSIVLGWYSAGVSFAPEELASLPPAAILNNSLHGMLLSPPAQELLRPIDPELAERHAEVEWCERHLAAVLSLYSRLASPSTEKIAALLGRLEAAGVGAAEDMLILDERSLAAIRSSPGGQDTPCWADPGIWKGLSPHGRAEVFGFKLFLDGALAMRTAALSEPYLQGGDGLLLYDDAALREKLKELSRLGKPIAIHAIGGRAVEQGLCALEELRLGAVRLEHVQFIDEDQAHRARELGLTLCMQPNFSVESRDYADRLSESHLRGLNPFRMLIDRMGFRPGRDLLFGSDGMPHGAQAAWQWGLFPRHEAQRLTCDELALGYGPPAPGGRTFRLLVDDERRLVVAQTAPFL
ncbi:MAG: amidohydrolase family protein [Elusimicrobia bacterium]|nr:amidohydrolase family protein [Elusimicrobiota bacterium]